MLLSLFMLPQPNKRTCAATCNKEASDMGFDTFDILLNDVYIEHLMGILGKLAKNKDQCKRTFCFKLHF